jgi:hypothetical protein
MSYILKSDLCELQSIVISPSVVKVGGSAEYVNGKLYFYLKSSQEPFSISEKLLAVVRASIVEVDCDNTLTYANGENVYEHATVPTGIVNKTSASRRLVGYVRHPEGNTYPVGTSKIQIRYTGSNEV